MNSMSSTKRAAYIAIVLFGIVSLLGDTVYEGARGIVPDYLYFLGASALIVGLASGLGEFLGYVVRLLSGELADRTRAYWAFIFAGYGLIVTIPLLGFSLTWEIAVILIVLERIGKGFRAPSRDTVLSIVSRELGPGKAFGIHELLDQVGAVLGPLIVAMVLLATADNYQLTFLVLGIPFLMLVASLGFTYSKVGSMRPPEVGQNDTQGEPDVSKRLGRPFYTYTVAVLLNTAGLVPAALILFRASTVLQPQGLVWLVPIVYVVIQGVDAVVAPIAGLAFDRHGLKVLIVPFVLSVFPPLFLSSGAQLTDLFVASAFFGLVLGMQESTYRAAVSKFAPTKSRGRAYGIFNTAYGIAFLIAGAVYGAFIDFNTPFVVMLAFVIGMQALAVAALTQVKDKRAAEAKMDTTETEASDSSIG